MAKACGFRDTGAGQHNPPNNPNPPKPSGRTMKQAIDIEDLLIWAYRDQCVDRMERAMRGSTRGPGWGSGGAVWELGTRVDTSGAHLAMLGATAPDDALLVHDAVLDLGDMWIERAPVAGSADMDVAVWERAEIEAAGWRLAETARGPVILRPDPREVDLVAEHPVTRSVVTALIVLHAKAGDRPEVHAGWRRPVGRPRLAAYADGAAQGEVHAVTAADVIWHRAVYCVWHATLVALAAELDGVLVGFAVTGPSAPEAPWECQAGRILTAENRANPNEAKHLMRRRKKVGLRA
jgi:hypothetical protein